MHIMANTVPLGKKVTMLIITINITNNSNTTTSHMHKIHHSMMLTTLSSNQSQQNLELEVHNQMEIRQVHMLIKNIITNIISNIMQDIKELLDSSHLLTTLVTTRTSNTMVNPQHMDSKMQTMIQVNSSNNHHQQMILQIKQMENLINEGYFSI